MSTLLIERAHCVATQDDAGSELADASVFVRDGWIEAVLPASSWVATQWARSISRVDMVNSG